MTESTQRLAPRRRALAIVAGAALVLAAAVLYGKIPGGGKKSSGQCAFSDTVIPRVAALEKGAVAAAASARQAAPVVALDFLGPDGKNRSLSEFQGKVVLLNLWATWCVPCREEMPTLDKLQGLLGSRDFEVVAVNVDTVRLDRAKNFLDDIHVKNLAFYSDPKADVLYRLKTAGKVLGLPTSILVGRDGCEIAAMAGPADWASDDALAMLRAAL